MLTAVGMTICIVTFPLISNLTLVLVVFGLLQFFNGCPIGVAAASIQVVTPNRMRGQVTAIYLFFANLIGAGMGPVVIALFTDLAFKSEQDLGFSIVLTGAIFGPIALLLLWICRPLHLREVQSVFNDTVVEQR